MLLKLQHYLSSLSLIDQLDALEYLALQLKTKLDATDREVSSALLDSLHIIQYEISTLDRTILK